MSKQKAHKRRRDIYQETTDRVVAHLESGELPPWRLPLKGVRGNPFPRNFATGKAYRGVNIWLLSLASWCEGFLSPSWMTFRQAKARGGQVRRGEKGSLVTFWKQYTKEDAATGEETTLPVLRHYIVFNVDQIDGIEEPMAPEAPAEPFEPIARAESILEGYSDRPEIETSSQVPCYTPSSDTVRMPPADRFVTEEDYYVTLMHELVHSTGHSKRLDRGLDGELTPYGSRDYSKEELVAEMGAAFLAAASGISPPTIEQSAAYIEGWLKQLRADKKLLISAAGQSQRACDLILGTTFDGEGQEPEAVSPSL